MEYIEGRICGMNRYDENKMNEKSDKGDRQIEGPSAGGTDSSETPD